jgi:DNA-binding CsgD family transcriptional regulator
MTGRDTSASGRRAFSHLVGRSEVIEVLIDFLTRGSGSLGLVADPGGGTTSLIDAGAEFARSQGKLVLRTDPAYAERDLPYAGAHQLLRRLDPGFPGTETSHSDALERAWRALSSTFGVRPVVLVIDHVHRLDDSSRALLGGVLERAASADVLVLAACRGPQLPGLPPHRVEALDDESAARLLWAVAPDRDFATRARVRAEARGNPLALVELSRAWREHGERGRELDRQTPFTQRLMDAMLECPGGLSDDDLVAVVGLADGALADDRAAIERAAETGLVVRAGAGFAWRHPLVVEALLRFAPPHVMRRLRGRAASEARDRVPYWLQSAADMLLRGQGYSEALRRLEYAAEVTPDGPLHWHLRIRAAVVATWLGRGDLVRDALRATAGVPLDPADRINRLSLRQLIGDTGPDADAWLNDVCDAADDMLAADAASGNEDERGNVLDLFSRAVIAGMWESDPGDAVRERVLRTVQAAAPGRVDDPRRLVTLSLAGPVRLAPDLRAELADLAESMDAPRFPEWLWLAGLSARALGETVLAVRILTATTPTLIARGRCGLAVTALTVLAQAEIAVGRWQDAATHAAEAASLAAAADRPVWQAQALASTAIIAGLRGRTDEAWRQIRAGERALGGSHASGVRARLQLARGLAQLNAHRYDDAYAEIRPIFRPGDPAYHRLETRSAVAFLAEAAAHCGERTDVEAVLSALEAEAGTGAPPLLRVHLAYARAVLSDGPLDETFPSAAEDEVADWPWVRARLQLAHGSWLRRNRQVTGSRDVLTRARSTFAHLGAAYWTARADAELDATGAVSRSDGDELLSPQERRIAGLAATGLSNRQIGQQLRLSPRTVGSHLYRIFPKLDITSRGQLAERLSDLACPSDAAT